MKINFNIHNFSSKPSFGNSANRYRSYVQNTPDYKKNPNEHEVDKKLGLEIESLTKEITKLEEELKTAQNFEQKRILENNLYQLRDKLDNVVNTLVERQLRLTLEAAHTYNSRYPNTDFDDLVSAATKGLIVAARKYEPSTFPNAHFATYAEYHIKNQIEKYIHKNTRYGISTHTLILKRKIQEAKSELLKELDREPTIQELSSHLNVSVKRLNSAMIASGISMISLDDVIRDEKDATNFSNFVPDPNSSKAIEIQMQEEDLKVIAQTISDYLSPREEHIIKARYYRNMVRADIARELGISGERVRQLEEDALTKLKTILNRSPLSTDPFPESETSTIPPEKNLRNNLLFDKLIENLAKNENPKVKEKIINRLDTFDIDEFEKVLQNTLTPKMAEVIRYKYFKNSDISLYKISQKLNLTLQSIVTREERAIRNLKNFLLEDDNLGYSNLKEAICLDIRGDKKTTALTKRVNQTSSDKLKLIMQNILTPQELEILNTKYCLKSQNLYGCKVKNAKELSQIFKTPETSINSYIYTGIKKLKAYFSKSSEANTNLANFAQVVTSTIKDKETRKNAIQEIKKFKPEELYDFLKKLLNEKEYIILTKRYNLDKPNEPQLPVEQYKTLGIYFNPQITRQTAEEYAYSAIEKIRKYFEYGINSSRVTFTDELLSSITDNNLKTSIKSKIMNMGDEEFNECLNTVLSEKDALLIKTRYNLDNSNKIALKAQNRESYFQEFANTIEGVRYKEAMAMERLLTYFTVGLPSNIEKLAEEISKNAKNKSSEEKITEKFKNKTIQEINEELSQVLNPFYYQIIHKVFSLDKYYSVCPETPDMVQFSKEINRLVQTIYSAKRTALEILAEIYQKDETSNLDYFIDKICSKTKDENLNKKIRTTLSNMSKEELLTLINELLPDINREILIKHYDLDKHIKLYKKPVKLDEVAKELNVHPKRASEKESNSFKILIEYFKNQSI